MIKILLLDNNKLQYKQHVWYIFIINVYFNNFFFFFYSVVVVWQQLLLLFDSQMIINWY